MVKKYHTDDSFGISRAILGQHGFSFFEGVEISLGTDDKTFFGTDRIIAGVIIKDSGSVKLTNPQSNKCILAILVNSERGSNPFDNLPLAIQGVKSTNSSFLCYYLTEQMFIFGFEEEMISYTSVSLVSSRSVSQTMTQILSRELPLPDLLLGDKSLVNIINSLVLGLEPHISRLNTEPLEKSLGFFMTKLVDANVGKNEKTKTELQKAIVKATSFFVVSQLLVYQIIQTTRNADGETTLQPLKFVSTTSEIQHIFDQVPHGWYQGLFGFSLVADLPDESVIPLNKAIAVIMALKLEYARQDLLGKIFHLLIPLELRKRLAAYYSSNDAGRLIANLIIENSNVKILDPACGSGTLLVSSYQRLKELNPSLTHQEVVQKLYGNDVSSFTSLLASLNLAIQDPLLSATVTNLTVADIFQVNTTLASIEKQKDKSCSLQIPTMDVLVGNPPFTRGERMDSAYKESIRRVLMTYNLDKYIDQSMGLHAYFLLDSYRFLKEGGVFAYILPYSVLYSKSLVKIRHFLLLYYDIRCVITTHAEVSFSEDTSTKEVIIIGEKLRDPTSRMGTLFVTLLEPLAGRVARVTSKIKSYLNDRLSGESDSVLLSDVSFEKLHRHVDRWDIHFLPPVLRNFYENLSDNPLITPLTQYCNKTFRGSWYKGAKYIFIPNSFFDITEESDKNVVLKHRSSRTSVAIPKSELTPILSRSEHYRKVVIYKPTTYAITPAHNFSKHLKHYISLVCRDLGSVEQEIASVFRKSKSWFIHESDWAFVHRVDFTTTRILCYYTKKPEKITQNFFSGHFSGTTEHKQIIAAWCNSSLFIATLLATWRQHRGSFGQTAVREFKEYLILKPDMLDKDQANKILKALNDFVLDSENLPSLLDQLKACISMNEACSTNKRLRLDLSLLNALGYTKKHSWSILTKLYKEIHHSLTLMQKQKKSISHVGLVSE